MFLLHGTGWNAGRLIMTAMRDGRDLKEHNVIWKDNSRRDRIYFWIASGNLYDESVGVSREMIMRAGESAMYSKAVAGKTDRNVCVLTIYADETGRNCLIADPDCGGVLPGGYMNIGDFNECVKKGHVRLVTAVYDKLYQPELRYEYLASMMLYGRKFYMNDVEDKALMKALAKIRNDAEDIAAFRRLFENPLLKADWKVMMQ